MMWGTLVGSVVVRAFSVCVRVFPLCPPRLITPAVCHVLASRLRDALRRPLGAGPGAPIALPRPLGAVSREIRGTYRP